MRVCVKNAQRTVRVESRRVERLARRAVRRLHLSEPGELAITFVSDQRMRSLNRRFLGHDWPTDVLSFRYDEAQGLRLEARGKNARGSRLKALGNGLEPGASSLQRCSLQPPTSSLQPIVGEILIAPSQARAYAKAHGISYDEELARYVVHGLLHWMGQEDRTRAQQAKMRRMENELLAHCGAGR